MRKLGYTTEQLAQHICLFAKSGAYLIRWIPNTDRASDIFRKKPRMREEIRNRNWRLRCPRQDCRDVEDYKEFTRVCGNCGGPLVMSFMHGLPWDAAGQEANRSWRRLKCAQNCGWWANQWPCRKCGTIITGDFIETYWTWF